MKLQKFLLLGLALGSIKNIDASVTADSLNTTNVSLYNAANSLASALHVTYTGIQPTGYQGSTGFSDQGFGTIQATVTNYSVTTVSLIVKNASNQQINSPIILAGQSFTYLPPDAATIELFDNKNKKTLVASTPVKESTPYSITDVDNTWAITKLNTTATFDYKNTTNIPLVVKITINNMEIKEQVNPANSFSQTINPSTALARKMFISNGDLKLKYSPLVSIEVHANLSPLAMMFEPNASYQISIDATTNQLSCKQTATSGNIIVNKTGWPMFIDVTSEDVDFKDVILQDGNSYKPDTSALNILIIPIIENQRSEIIPAKSFNIANNKGILTF